MNTDSLVLWSVPIFPKPQLCTSQVQPAVILSLTECFSRKLINKTKKTRDMDAKVNTWATEVSCGPAANFPDGNG